MSAQAFVKLHRITGHSPFEGASKEVDFHQSFWMQANGAPDAILCLHICFVRCRFNPSRRDSLDPVVVATDYPDEAPVLDRWKQGNEPRNKNWR